MVAETLIVSIQKFRPDEWVERLAHCVELELLTWRVRMSMDTLRGLALDCTPWHEEVLAISFLTTREEFDFDDESKWETASWRLFNFTSGPNTSWPFAVDVMREARGYYVAGGSAEEQEKRRDELCRCCAVALRHPSVQAVLNERYALAADFGLYAGHPDDPRRNCCSEIGT